MKIGSNSTHAWSRRAAATDGRSLRVDMSPLSLRYRAKNMISEPEDLKKIRLRIRIINVVVAAAGLVIATPLMLIIAAAIKVSSRGPVIFKQPRVGLDRRRGSHRDGVAHRRNVDRGGRIFTIYKFRTMRSEPTGSQQQWATKADPRITVVGRFLRATRLDELPQLFNVLLGDMNIVGPRPEQPEIFSELHRELGPRYRNRQRVLPGITGLAQVEQGYDTDLDSVRRKVALDLKYIGKRTPGQDLTIMAKTLPVMVLRKGAH